VNLAERAPDAAPGSAEPIPNPREAPPHIRAGAFSLLSPERIFSSAGVRFGLIYATLFAISAAALAGFVWWSTAGLLDRETDAAINADMQGLAEQYEQGGTRALINTINERIAGNIDDDAIYLLVDPNFRILAGNLDHWPMRVTMDVDWFELPMEVAGIRSMARVHYLDLPGGYHLLVGRDVQVRAHLRRLLTDALLWAAGIVVLLGSIGAIAVRSLFRFTIADVSAVASAVSAGDLTRRVRLTGQGDEFDALAGAINDMLDRIALLMDGVRQVSNAIAHDLRTPIARARARLEDAAVHAASEADLRAAIDRATADLDGIVSVFQALLRIAEIEAGARRSAFAVIDLAPLLADIAELYAALAEERGQVLQPRVPRAALVLGDRDMLQQAVANLLDNAVKFSPRGGRIELSAEATATGVEITVADHGPGIPRADRARAPERFFRGELARSTRGSGLGLSLVQAVATLHGGVLRLDDNGPGLRATMVLPLPDRAAAPVVAPA
jgi:signal transduction histidine kinase